MREGAAEIEVAGERIGVVEADVARSDRRAEDGVRTDHHGREHLPLFPHSGGHANR
jgi:hypothetical protein